MGLRNKFNKLKRKTKAVKTGLKNNTGGDFRKRFAKDAEMTVVNAALTASPIGMAAAAVTGKDIDDLTGYEYTTDVGKEGDRISDTVSHGIGVVAPAAIGIGVTAATGSPQAGKMAMQGMTGVQDMYDSVDSRESDSYLDPDMADGAQNIINQGAGLGMGFMGKNGGQMKKYADGGELTHFEGGGTHEQNPNGGIPQGQNAVVEAGETKVDDYIFSDRLKAPGGLLDALKLDSKKWSNKTFAEVSKAIEQKYDPQSNRKTDEIVKRGIKKDLEKLKEGQEIFKLKKNIPSPQKEAVMSYGGPIKYPEGGFAGYDINDPNIPNLYGDMGTMDTLGISNPGMSGGGLSDAGRSMSGYNPGSVSSGGGGMPSGGPGMGEVMNTFNGITATANSMAMIRDLKKNKPKPKDIKMFDSKTKIRNPKLDFRSIFRANEESEGRARRSIASNSKNASDLIASNIALNRGTQNQNAQTYTKTQQIQAGLDMQVDQMKVGQENANMGRRMQVTDWNDQDEQVWMNALMEARNQMGNNMRQTSKNQYNLEQGKSIEGKDSSFRSGRNKK